MYMVSTGLYKVGYMQAHTKDMHDKEQLFPNDMIFGSQVSRLAKSRLGKLVNFPNWIRKVIT